MSTEQTKFVIADRLTGRYSERFDNREDAERALQFFTPVPPALPLVVRSTRYEILEAESLHGQWFILDPTCPKDAIYILPR